MKPNEEMKWEGVPYPSLWGKQKGIDGGIAYPLALHLRDTASAAKVVWRIWLREGLKEKIARQFPESVDAEEVVAYIAGLHDLGKANPLFGCQLQLRDAARPNWIREQSRLLKAEGLLSFGLSEVPELVNLPIFRKHALNSALLVDNRVLNPNQRSTSVWESLVVAGHHGIYDLVARQKDTARAMSWYASNTKWSDAVNEIHQDLKMATVGGSIELPEDLDLDIVVLLTGITILADRMASTAESVEAAIEGVIDGSLPTDQPKEWVAKRTDEFEALLENSLGVFHNFENPGEAILGQFSPRPVQDLAGKHANDQLFFAMTETGSGKTEAAVIRHCQVPHPENLMFLLPTQATSSAIMDRLRQLFRQNGNIASLAHSLAIVNDFYRVPVEAAHGLLGQESEASRGARLEAGLFPTGFVTHGSARLLAPVCVATIDQALLSTLPTKWTALRLLAIANSHLIMDEAHTYAPYQMELVKQLMWWLGRMECRVTVLSATMPSGQREEFISAYEEGRRGSQSVNRYDERSAGLSAPVSFPSVSTMDNGQGNQILISGQPRQVEASLIRSSDSVKTLVEWVIANRENFPSATIGVIVNQVQRAQEIGRQLQDRGVFVVILHSRMTAGHRRQVEEALREILGKGAVKQPIVVVGTQVIECSLDIDFDFLASDLCPSASLVQRMGRLWRHEDPLRPTRVGGMKRPELTVVSGIDGTEDSGWHLPYFVNQLASTATFIENLDDGILRVPDDIQDFVECSYRTFEDCTEPGSGADDGMDELVQLIREKTSAKDRLLDFELLLGSGSTVGLFSRLTGSVEFEETATRFIERETNRCLVLAIKDRNTVKDIPGMWRGDIQDVRINGEGAKILDSLVSIPAGTMKDQLKPIDEVLDCRIPAYLQGVFVLDGSDESVKYDPLLGLLLP